MSTRIPIQDAPELDPLQRQLWEARRTIRELREALAEERIRLAFGDLLPSAHDQRRQGAA